MSRNQDGLEAGGEQQLTEALAKNAVLQRALADALLEVEQLAELVGRVPVLTSKWEYRCVTHRALKAEETDVLFDEFGAEGWELVNSTVELAFFKRRVVTR